MFYKFLTVFSVVFIQYITVTLFFFTVKTMLWFCVFAAVWMLRVRSDIQNTETNSLKHLYNINVDDYFIKIKVFFFFHTLKCPTCDSSWKYPFKFPFFYNRLYFITSVFLCKTFILTGTEFRLSLGHTSLTYARLKGTQWLMNSRS